MIHKHGDRWAWEIRKIRARAYRNEPAEREAQAMLDRFDGRAPKFGEDDDG